MYVCVCVCVCVCVFGVCMPVYVMSAYNRRAKVCYSEKM